MRPCLDGLQFFLQVSRYLPVVQKKDKEPFPIADAIPQFVGFEGVLDGEIGLSHVPVKEP